MWHSLCHPIPDHTRHCYRRPDAARSEPQCPSSGPTTGDRLLGRRLVPHFRRGCIYRDQSTAPRSFLQMDIQSLIWPQHPLPSSRLQTTRGHILGDAPSDLVALNQSRHLIVRRNCRGRCTAGASAPRHCTPRACVYSCRTPHLSNRGRTHDAPRDGRKIENRSRPPLCRRISRVPSSLPDKCHSGIAEYYSHALSQSLRSGT